MEVFRRLVVGVLLPAALVLGAAGSVIAASSGVMPYPEPGTYKLNKIQRVPFSVVVDGTGYPRLLSNYTTGKLTLFTFFYGLCTDPKGCPLLWDAFFKVRESIETDPLLRDRVQLVFYSFDPEHDVPETLQLFSDLENQKPNSTVWHFITAWSKYLLKSTLQGLGQEIYQDKAGDGSDRVIVNHALKVLLIDADGWIREIYSSNFLNPEVIVGDLKTLAMEESGNTIGQ